MPISALHTPGVYVQEVPAGPRPIQAVGTSTPVFIGAAPLEDALVNDPRAVNNWSEFVGHYMQEEPKDRESTVLSNAVFGFFENLGSRCFIVNTGGKPGIQDALAAAATVDEIAIVAAPGVSDPATHLAIQAHCEGLEDRVGILDTIEKVDDIELLTQLETLPEPKGGKGRRAGGADQPPKEGGLLPSQSDRGFTTVYFPWIRVTDPFSN